MNQTELQGKSLDALKSLNNTITTIRLYPPEAPQVSSAVERSYKTLKSYLREYGKLTYSLKEGNPHLCGQLLSREILDSFPNLIIYRQLRLLGLFELEISSEMDRFAFGQLLTVFTASAEKIANEGGGLEFITSLGLASYFREEPDDLAESVKNTDSADAVRTRNLLSVRPELVACLFGKDRRPVIETELQNKMIEKETAIDILAAGIATILKDIQKKKMIAASEYFPLMLKKAETLIASSNRQEVALGLANVLVESLKEPALCVLSAQEYPEGFGSMVYDGLIASLSAEKIAGIIILFREQLAKAGRAGEAHSPRVQFLRKALLVLMNSKKGKHFISTEKARNIIHEGEIERRKRRLSAGIKGFLQGNTSLLQSEELVEYLPDAVRQIQKNTNGREVTLLLNGMVAYLEEAGAKGQDPLLKSMITVGENLIADGDWNLADIILKPLLVKVRQGGLPEDLLEKIVIFLQQAMQKSRQAGASDRADGILTLFHQIRSGQIRHPAAIKAIVAKVQDRGIKRAHLPQLLAACLADPNNETLSCRLIFQGPVAVHFLVESLIKADNAPDRLKIIDLLTYSPNLLPAIVHERLQEHMVWYGKRNLIKLLGETGKEEDAERILPYLRHEDFRVQRETFLTLYKLAGRNRKQLLLRALDESAESIKVQIVDALVNFCDPEVAGKLVALLESHEQFTENNRKNLLLQLLATLGRCPCPPAYKGVSAFLQTRGQRATRKITDQVWVAAEKALKFLHNELQETRRKHVQASQLRKNAMKQAAKMSKNPISKRIITGLPEEQAARSCLAQGDKIAAVELVLGLIERVARLRNFVQAQKLREWLIDIDPTALSEILRAAEIIDREKIAAIDKSHLEIWGGLYDILSTDEFSAVYHALNHKEFENEERVVNQGDLLGNLFFINSGKVKLYFDKNGKDVLVKIMGRGEIFGAEAFFDASFWTISAASIGPSEISILRVDTLLEWAEEFPGLESKLHNFCKKFKNIEDFVKQSENDRRLYKRYRISGRVLTTLVDNRGRSLGTDFKVELADISEGGLSFLARISQRVHGRLLLGRKMQLSLPPMENFGDEVMLVGDILAVKNTYAVENDYSLHMKFDTLIDRKLLHDIVTTMRQESKVQK